MRSHLITLAACAALPAFPCAQSPTDTWNSPSKATAAPLESDASEEVIPIHTAEPRDGIDYGIWGVGPTYKASFHDDPTFVPYLGSGAPENLPLAFRTREITAGGETIVGRGEVPDRHHSDFRYEYRFGAVTEAYDLLAAGLEQTFVVHRRPARGGDIVVTGTFNTPMRAENFGPTHRAIDFHGPDGEIYVRYGEATAIDARGETAPILTSFRDGDVTLTVDGGWLETAVYPVTLDPLTTRVRISSGALRRSPDLAAGASQMGIVFCRIASASDCDVFLRLIDRRFQNQGTTVWVDATAAVDSRHIRVCALDSPTKYLLAYERRANGAIDVSYHVHDINDLTLSTQAISLGSPVGPHDWRPDCGGSTRQSRDDAGIIVFQRENGASFVNTMNSEIWAVTVDVSQGSGANSTHTPPFQLPATAGGSADQERPAINRRARAEIPTHWTVVWQEIDNTVSGDDWDVVGRQLASNRLVSSSFYTNIEDNNGMHKLAPTISGESGRYLIAYSQVNTNVGRTPTNLGTEFLSERFDWDNGNQPVAIQSNFLQSPSSSQRYRLGRSAYDRSADSFWMVPLVSDAVSGPGTGDLFVYQCGYTGEVVEVEFVHDASATSQNGYGIAISFDNNTREFPITYVANGDPLNINNTLNGNYGMVYSYDPITPSSTSSVSCSPASIFWNSRGATSNTRQRIGNEFGSIQVGSTPPNSVHFLILGTQAINMPVSGPGIGMGCNLLVPANGPGHVGIFPIQIGVNASWNLPLPPFLNSMTLYFQDWHSNSATTRFISSQRLEVPIAK